MARSKSHRKSHRRSGRKHSSSRKNIIKKTFDESVNVVKNTSKKYMPKVKSGLENVGSKVVSTGSKSIPFLQNMTRKFFGLFSKKSNSNKSKSRKNRK
jgi:hypothetical protein